MSVGLIARKAGMTQVFQPDGTMVAVSVLEVAPNVVTRLRTPERDGYAALQVGAAEGKRISKPVAGQLKGLPQVSTMREFRLASDKDLGDYEVGQALPVNEVFAEGDLVDVTGVSKGKGFAGHVKRHGFGRGPTTHGSDHHREPGSIGPGTTPGRVYKGLRMAGHMGDEQVTTKKLRVVRADAENNLLLLRGSVPGARGSLILVRKA
ncbi:MAG TPA: 50S ribosomal protein L3 [Candidatus Limnocylindrales bacterium]|nr:50S ribosomal protein L3 [Candidatus Limnocylindrales bacterium]